VELVEGMKRKTARNEWKQTKDETRRALRLLKSAGKHARCGENLEAEGGVIYRDLSSDLQFSIDTITRNFADSGLKL
jgi:hypothetical protein